MKGVLRSANFETMPDVPDDDNIQGFSAGTRSETRSIFSPSTVHRFDYGDFGIDIRQSGIVVVFGDVPDEIPDIGLDLEVWEWNQRMIERLIHHSDDAYVREDENLEMTPASEIADIPTNNRITLEMSGMFAEIEGDSFKASDSEMLFQCVESLKEQMSTVG